MRSLKKYIKFHKETFIILILLLIINIFAILSHKEKNDIFSLIYMVFVIVCTIRIVFNKINA